MKTFSKIMALALVFVCCVSAFAACGGGSNEFIIGGSGPLTGANSEYGTAVYNGAMIAINEINEKGGLNGVTFKLDMRQDDCTALGAENAYNSLYAAGMKASIGSVTSGSAEAFANSAKEDNIICMTPSASADPVIATGNHSFRVCFGDPQQGSLAADEMVTNKDYKKIGVIYDESDTYSTGLYEAFAARMTALNKVKGTDYVVYTFNEDSNKDFNVQVTEIKNAGCDAIFLPIYYGEAALILKAAAAIGFNAPVLGCDGLDGLAGELDNTVTAEIRYITPFDVNNADEKIAAFVAKYEAAYGEKPNQFAADGYDAVMIIYEAMKAGNVDPAADAATITDALIAVLTGGTFKYTGVTGSDMTWETSGSCDKAATIVTIAH